MPKARPWRTMRSKSSEAVCAMASSSTKNSWNSSMMQQRARHRLRAAGPLVAGDVLHAEFAEHVAAPPQFLVDALEHAEGEFAVALDGDDSARAADASWRST